MPGLTLSHFSLFLFLSHIIYYLIFFVFSFSNSTPICSVLKQDMSTSLLSLSQERNLKLSKHFHVLVFRIFFVLLDNKLDH